jgi:site-specific DNA-methyltransferase (adenine-specific)
MTQPFHQQQGITLYHGDCLSILPTLPAASVDFVLTDPPYLVNYRGRWDSARSPIAGDDSAGWLLPAYRELYRLLKPDSFLVTFYGWPHADLFVSAFKTAGFRLVSHLAFIKNVWGLGRFTRGQHENAYVLAKGRPKAPTSGISDVIEWTRDTDGLHPNQKPIGALHPLMRAFAPESGTVLDPFMGSGSTLIAARDFGLTAIGIDCDQRWCRYAASRLSQGLLFARFDESPPLGYGSCEPSARPT